MKPCSHLTHCKLLGFNTLWEGVQLLEPTAQQVFFSLGYFGSLNVSKDIFVLGRLKNKPFEKLACGIQ